jgi:hypothetical protein
VCYLIVLNFESFSTSNYQQGSAGKNGEEKGGVEHGLKKKTGISKAYNDK